MRSMEVGGTHSEASEMICVHSSDRAHVVFLRPQEVFRDIPRGMLLTDYSDGVVEAVSLVEGVSVFCPPMRRVGG